MKSNFHEENRKNILFWIIYTYYVKIPNRKHNQQKKNNNPKLVNQVQKRNAGLVQETKI